MKKMHLGARVPNEGARRMAWHILTACRGDMRQFAWDAMMDLSPIQRLIDGDVVPGEDLCARIGIATGDQVRRLDWQSKPGGGWFDAPLAREPRPGFAGVDRIAA